MHQWPIPKSRVIRCVIWVLIRDKNHERDLDVIWATISPLTVIPAKFGLTPVPQSHFTMMATSTEEAQAHEAQYTAEMKAAQDKIMVEFVATNGGEPA